MTLAYDYPLLGLMWTMLVFFLFFAWIMCLFYVFADIFRSHDMGGFAKFLWILFIIILPFLGVLIYLLARGDKMAEHRMADMQAQDAAFKQYVQQAAGSSGGGTADQLAQLAQLKDSGAISDAEFQAGKAKILG
jgi:hypothetical protein